MSKNNTAATSVDTISPTYERFRHSGVERLEHPIGDESGAPSLPWRSIDILSAMERRGVITSEMAAAGEDFRIYFRRAHLDSLRAADLARLPGHSSAEGGDQFGGRVENARRVVHRALAALGTAGSSCVWHVVGLELSLKEWALTRGWQDRRITQETASGILISALGTLEAHFGGAK